jgi:5-methylcytosine-specific restriction endonuclease McrA
MTERRPILERDGHTCQQCGAPANQVDHRTPRAEGGTDDESNLLTLCLRCHRRKSGAEGARARGRGRCDAKELSR